MVKNPLEIAVDQWRAQTDRFNLIVKNMYGDNSFKNLVEEFLPPTQEDIATKDNGLQEANRFSKEQRNLQV